jgi:hypothetical protein
MGLFGDLDASEIPENPYYVAPGTYPMVLVKAERVEKKDKTGEGLSFTWKIEDEDSEYDGGQVQDWKNIYPDISRDEVTQNVRKSLSFLRSRLSEMGLSESEQDNLLEPGALEELVGLHAYVTVVETPDRNDPDVKYSNVKKVTLDYDGDPTDLDV